MWITIVKIFVICGILCRESIRDIKLRKVHILGAVLIALTGAFTLFYHHQFSVLSFCMSESVGLFLYVISILTEEKIGRGDAFYVMALGTILNYREMIMAGMISFVLSAIAGIILLIAKKADRKTRLPYLPFLTGAYLMVSTGGCLV